MCESFATGTNKGPYSRRISFFNFPASGAFCVAVLSVGKGSKNLRGRQTERSHSLSDGEEERRRLAFLLISHSESLLRWSYKRPAGDLSVGAARPRPCLAVSPLHLTVSMCIPVHSSFLCNPFHPLLLSSRHFLYPPSPLMRRETEAKASTRQVMVVVDPCPLSLLETEAIPNTTESSTTFSPCSVHNLFFRYVFIINLHIIKT